MAREAASCCSKMRVSCAPFSLVVISFFLCVASGVLTLLTLKDSWAQSGPMEVFIGKVHVPANTTAFGSTDMLPTSFTFTDDACKTIEDDSLTQVKFCSSCHKVSDTAKLMFIVEAVFTLGAGGLALAAGILSFCSCCAKTDAKLGSRLALMLGLGALLMVLSVILAYNAETSWLRDCFYRLDTASVGGFSRYDEANEKLNVALPFASVVLDALAAAAFMFTAVSVYGDLTRSELEKSAEELEKAKKRKDAEGIARLDKRMRDLLDRADDKDDAANEL